MTGVSEKRHSWQRAQQMQKCGRVTRPALPARLGLWEKGSGSTSRGGVGRRRPGTMKCEPRWCRCHLLPRDTQIMPCPPPLQTPTSCATSS